MFGLKLLMHSALTLLSYAGPGTNGDIMPPIGGELDTNNCLTGAGFSWCEELQDCVRRWETPCQDDFSDCVDCLRKQRQGQNIACPQECDNENVDCLTNEDCSNSYFCRPVTRTNDAKECYPYSKNGDSCGGYTLPMYESRCHPSLDCVHSKSSIRPSVPMIEDAPGICMPKCPSSSIRDEYGTCIESELSHPPILGISNECEECRPAPCPPPGPDCEYTPPRTDECGCSIGCGGITCHAEDPLPLCSEVMCMMYCENGHQIDENGCNLCACNEPAPLINPDEMCPIPYEECHEEYVCPKITEVTQCSEGGIVGTTTYQLSLVIRDNTNIKNVYALYGDTLTDGFPMSFPPAYQVKTNFRTNLGGIANNIIDISPNSRYDSWLTIGITDGDPDNQLASIGIDFETWDINSPLIVNNGAIFTMDPDYDLHGLTEVIIGRLTLPTQVSAIATMNVQGKLKYSEETWKQSNVHFEIIPPQRVDNSIQIPLNCEIWFDGCNTCQIRNGNIGACTRMMCFREEEPYCMRTIDGH